jgi:hypothetical protein
MRLSCTVCAVSTTFLIFALGCQRQSKPIAGTDEKVTLMLSLDMAFGQPESAMALIRAGADVNVADIKWCCMVGFNSHPVSETGALPNSDQISAIYPTPRREKRNDPAVDHFPP